MSATNIKADGKVNFWAFANPSNFMKLSGALLPWVTAGAVLCLAIGLGWSLFGTPPAFDHGEAVKILFVHVPSAMLAINTYFLMMIASLIGLIRRHPVSHLIAKAAAPIGAGFTIIAIVTGALWGQPGWGTWWVWDARLTSILVMLFFYMGYIAMWNAVEDPVKAAELAAILCLVGSVFAFLSRYAVLFFATLHQGATLSLDKEQNIADVYYVPLLIMIAGFYLLFIALLLVGVRTEIRARRIRAMRLAEA
ncbi:MAG: heme ABC transporter permease [Pseudomonadota bacterium]